MTAPRGKELGTLLRQLHRDPGNPDTLNSLAVWYFLCWVKGQMPRVDGRSLSKDDVRIARELNELENGWDTPDYLKNKAGDYFTRAYQLKRTVKSTHNFAWFLFYHSGEEERGRQVQQQCLALEPRSVYPYYQYGHMLWCHGRYGEAVPYFRAAYEREKDGPILNNMGVCYTEEGDFTNAKACFATVIEAGSDIDDKSTFNLALTEYKLGNVDQAKRLADTLTSRTKEMTDVSPFDLAEHYLDLADLYFVLGEYRRSFECLSKQGFRWYSRPGDSRSYAIYVSDELLWRKWVHDAMEKRLESIAELSSNDVQWSDWTDEEKQARVSEYQSEIEEWKKHLQNGFPEPTVDIIDGRLRIADYRCTLFDCTEHQTREDD